MDLIKDGYVLVNKNDAIVTAYHNAKTFYTNLKLARNDALTFGTQCKVKICKAEIVVDLDSEVT